MKETLGSYKYMTVASSCHTKIKLKMSGDQELTGMLKLSQVLSTPLTPHHQENTV